MGILVDSVSCYSVLIILYDRIAQHVIPILNYTLPILEEIESQIMAFGKQLTDQSPDELIVVSIAPEPFFKPFSHSRGGAYPHSPSREVTPASTFIAYQANATTPLGMFFCRIVCRGQI